MVFGFQDSIVDAGPGIVGVRCTTIPFARCLVGGAVDPVTAGATPGAPGGVLPPIATCCRSCQIIAAADTAVTGGGIVADAAGYAGIGRIGRVVFPAGHRAVEAGGAGEVMEAARGTARRPICPISLTARHTAAIPTCRISVAPGNATIDTICHIESAARDAG